MDGIVKVCFVSIRAYPLFDPKCRLNHGGAEVDLYNYAQELVKDKKYIVSFMVADVGQDLIEQYNGIKLIKSFSLKKNIKKIFFGPILLHLALKREDPDIIISEAAGFETGILCLYSRIYRKKFIYRTAHINDCNKMRIKSKWWGFSYAYALHGSDLILTQTTEQKRLIKENHNKFAIVLKNAYNIQNVHETKKEYILWVSRCVYWKRPEIFLKLAREFLKEKFIMIMPKTRTHRSLWNAISAEGKKLDNLELIEKVPFKEINEYFKRAKLYVNTSKYEGFPNTFIQAAMNKTPVLSLSVNPDSFITNHGCGLYSNNEYGNLVQNLQRLLEDHNFYTACSNKSFEYALKHHDLKKIIEELKEVILKLAD